MEILLEKSHRNGGFSRKPWSWWQNGPLIQSYPINHPWMISYSIYIPLYIYISWCSIQISIHIPIVHHYSIILYHFNTTNVIPLIPPIMTSLTQRDFPAAFFRRPYVRSAGNVCSPVPGVPGVPGVPVAMVPVVPAWWKRVKHDDIWHMTYDSYDMIYGWHMNDIWMTYGMEYSTSIRI